MTKQGLESSALARAGDGYSAATVPEAAAIPRVTVLGVSVANVTKREAIALLEEWICGRRRGARKVYLVNAHTLNLAHEDPSYRAVLNAADVVFGDGTGVRLAARLKGVRLKDNLVGTDLLPEFFAATLDRCYRCFLLGGAPGTASRAAAQLQRDFPGIRIAGHHHGYLDPRENQDVLGLIEQAEPDMLLVAMGNPMQERWIHDHLPRLRVAVSVGVGGLFDHWAGHLRRAPRWVRRLGMEWMQLLLQQPLKWRRYILGNPKFVMRAVLDARRSDSATGHAMQALVPQGPPRSDLGAELIRQATDLRDEGRSAKRPTR
jgi:N-acetylglucosaminyldiphosphoundecaprenol N-acetyl-beta-D-mannosaminyltransferase